MQTRQKLSPYFIRTGIERLSNLSPELREHLGKLIDLLSETTHSVSVQTALDTLFPFAGTTASANASLNRFIANFNASAESAQQSIRIAITKAKNVGAARRELWFEGAAEAAFIQHTPDLSAASKNLIDQQGIPCNDDADVVILTFNEHETAALLAAFCQGKTYPSETRGGITYNRLGMIDGMRIVHTVSGQGSATPGGALMSTSKAIEAWKPRAVIACGIACGMKGATKQKIGDVLVASQMQAYESARLNADGSVTARGDKVSAPQPLLNRINTYNQSLQEAQRSQWPKIETGLMLSGEKLIDDPAFKAALIKAYPDAIGAEMEGAGVYAAASDKKCDWLIIKGISDWGDGKKGENKTLSQQLAAKNAAHVLLTILAQGSLFPPQLERETRTRKFSPSCDDMKMNDLREIPPGCVVTNPAGIPASLEKDPAAAASPSSAASVGVLDYISEWLCDPAAPPLFALLGEYGMGKTITCQRLTRQLEEARQSDATQPLALYFDLRNLTGLKSRIPTWQETIEECARRGWVASAGKPFTLDDLQTVFNQPCLVIFDGLDEALVNLTEADGQTYTRNLLKLIADVQTSAQRARALPPKILLSCRTQYFPSLRSQQNHFTGQERGDYGAADFRALILQPFSEAQIRTYLQNALPDADIDHLIDVIRSVHNLEDLASRPFTLKLVAEFIPQIEQARAAGQTVRGVTLYRMVAQRWMDRDTGKHHIKPDHKLTLVAHLAAHIWRSGARVLPVTELHGWFHQWLAEQPTLAPRYATLHPDELEEDLRTATFLARQDADSEAESGFRFAHSSLQEFFLASYLFDAARLDLPERWAMPRPSPETLDFLGQLFDEAGTREPASTLAKLQAWRKTYRPQTSENLLAYALRAAEKTWPVPIMHGASLRGAQLQGWQFLASQAPQARLDLSTADFSSANLRETSFEIPALRAAIFSGAQLQGSLFIGCELSDANWQDAVLDGAQFRHCTLASEHWAVASAWRARFVLCQQPPSLHDSLLAPQADTQRPATARLANLSGHTSWVRSCAFSPDGRQLVSAGDDGDLRLWDSTSGECLRTFAGHVSTVLSCAFSPDGRQLASSAMDGSLRLWDVISGQALHTLSGHTPDLAWSCTFSPDGRQLASAGDDGSLRLWDVASGQALRTFCIDASAAWSCAFSPDGRQLASAGRDGHIGLWDVASGKVLHTLAAHASGAWSCAFSPDGRQLASAGMDGELRLWDTASGEALLTLSGHTDWILSCVFSPNGRQLASAGMDGNLRLWDAASGEAMLTLSGHRDWIFSCTFSPDGHQLLSAGMDGSLRLWDTASGAALRSLSGHAARGFSCAFSPDGAQLVSTGNHGSLLIWDAASGQALHKLTGHAGEVSSCTFSPDGRQLASAGDDGRLRLWDTASGTALRDFSGHANKILSCTFSPDGYQLASTGDDGSLRLWDVASGTTQSSLNGHKGAVWSCAFSPDGYQLASTGDDGSLRLWDAASGAALRTLSGHMGGVRSCAFSPDGHQLASAGMDGSLRLWDATNGEAQRALYGHADEVLSCAFSPDGRQLVSTGIDSSLRLWDTAHGSALRTLSGHVGGVRSCAFSPDGRQLASTGNDGSLRLWDVASGECLRTHLISQHGHAVWRGTQDLIEASGDIWRILQWIVPNAQGEMLPIPLESFGEVPEPKRLAS